MEGWGLHEIKNFASHPALEEQDTEAFLVALHLRNWT